MTINNFASTINQQLKKNKFILFIFTILFFLQNNIYSDTFNKQIHYIQDTNPEKQNPKRKWLILVYMAADNDLTYFAWSSLKFLANGANENVYIITQLNVAGNEKKTQRFLIEKNKYILLNKENQQKLDSGDPETLIDFCCYGLEKFPAENCFLILSDHGSGAVDRSHHGRLPNPSEFFILNASTAKWELDRNIEYLKSFDLDEEKLPRGLCYDETFQTYFTNQKLEYALKTICKKTCEFYHKQNFKFEIVGIDACLMQMIEVADIFKSYAKIVVASEEVELGPGWRYDKALEILSANPNINIKEFAKHIVKAYEKTYIDVTHDYTLSAIDLDLIDKLEKNINNFAEILIKMLTDQKDNSVRSVIRDCKTSIAFEEPSYIDIASFYTNLAKEIDKIELKNLNKILIKELKEIIQEGLKIINELVIENVSGNNISYAKGLSIYFPEKRIHSSYHKINFAQINQWLNLLLHYVYS